MSSASAAGHSYVLWVHPDVRAKYSTAELFLMAWLSPKGGLGPITRVETNPLLPNDGMYLVDESVLQPEGLLP